MPKAAGTLARAGRVYQIKVTLNQTALPIWRRLLVREDITLHKLHRVLQIAIGWEDCHLRHFIVGKVIYSSPPPYEDFFGDSSDDESEAKARLCEVLPRLKASIIYEYDFGDSWMHSIVVEDIVESAIEGQAPSCIAGADACPPEDCGDPPGSANLVEALTEPDLSRQPVPGPRPGLSCQAPAAMRTYFLGFSENSCSSSAGMSGGNRWAAIDRDPLWHHNGDF